MKGKSLLISIIILFIISTLLIVFIMKDNNNYGKLYINEVMATNYSTIKDEDNEYSDYIELYNGYDFDIDLTGYHLSDKEYDTSKYTFPNVVIKSKSYLLIFASSKNKTDQYIHTNFSLKEDGEVITLSDRENVILSKVKYEKTGYNTSYGYKNGRYVYYYDPTPGVENSGKTSYQPIIFKSKNNTIKVHEYITDNNIIYDSDGDFNQMIELYNYGKSDINLKGYFISDNLSDLSKYMMPDVVIKSNDYLVIYLSNKDKYSNNEIHANFKIKSGETFVLSNPTLSIVDKVKIITLPVNTSYGINDDKWCYYPTPTFGLVNNTKCFDKLGSDIVE